MIRFALAALQILAIATAWAMPRDHRPVAWALSVAGGASLASQMPLPAPVLLAVACAPPAALAGASWGALAGYRPWGALGAMLGILGAILAIPSLDQEQLGATYAALWLGSAAVGAASSYRSAAPLETRLVLLVALAGLAGESGGWLAWGRGYAHGFDIARVVSIIVLIAIVLLQAKGALKWLSGPSSSSRRSRLRLPLV